MQRLSNFYEYRFKTLPTYFLKKVFGFDDWHVYGSHIPDYVEVVARLGNSLTNRNVCIEIGCGLGNILRRVRYHKKIGIDLDEGVINALKFFKKYFYYQKLRNTEFITGSFEDIPDNLKIDLLIVVNWVHNLEFDELVDHLKFIESKYIITEGVEGYANFHSKELFVKYFKVLAEEIIGNRHVFLLSNY